MALGKGFAECPIKSPRQREFPERPLPRAALGKVFAEGLWAFAEGFRPSAKRPCPVVVANLTEGKHY
jgi:hypothetical protein